MIERFRQYIAKEKLFLPEDKILLAVSGGIDSVVMAELFHRAGFHFGIAHVNFSLRDIESDGDEDFVRELAGRYKVKFFTTRFNTAEEAKQRKLSTQMAARELRYDWFEDILDKEGFQYLATAHHRDDSVETFLINLSRGTGISGLHGILPKQGRILRPMLFAGRVDISEFAAAENISYREDSSNASTKYLRNRIRHTIIPEFLKLNPVFLSDMDLTIGRLRDAESIYKALINQKKKDLLILEENQVKLSLDEIIKLHPLKTWLYELLSDYNFSEAVVIEIIKSLDDISGKIFFSASHRLIKDREFLIITPIEDNTFSSPSSIQHYYLDEDDINLYNPLNLSISIEKADGFNIPDDPQSACLDLDKLTFPLNIRKWKQGDYFFPLGMKSKKKLSDYFTDRKFSIPQKENTWLLCDGQDIVWIIGHRIDDRYKVTSATRNIYIVRLKD